MLPLATTTWDENELAAMQAVIERGQFTMGDRVREFELAFSSYVGSRHAVMVNSGSSANLLAVAALRYRKRGSSVGPGDEVIVPAVSWSTTYAPLHQYGLRVKFVDIDPQTLNFDLQQLRGAITDRTRMIFAVNLLGNPNEFSVLQELIGERDILLLEDNCESLGAVYEGRQAGTFGVMGTFSTFFSHHISTMEGGVVVTDDEELWHILLSLRAHGWTRQLPAKNWVCEIGDDPFVESFRFVLPGYNVRPLELSGALGIEQLKKLPALIAGRRENATTFIRAFSNLEGVAIQREVGMSSWFGFAIILDGPQRRQRVVRALSKAGIECRPIVAGNFARNPVVKYFDHEIVGTLANADHVAGCGLFIGNHHTDCRSGLQEAAAIVREVH